MRVVMGIPMGRPMGTHSTHTVAILAHAHIRKSVAILAQVSTSVGLGQLTTIWPKICLSLVGCL